MLPKNRRLPRAKVISPIVVRITSAFARGYGETGGCFGVRRCCAAFLLPTNHAKQRENLRRQKIYFFPACVSWISTRECSTGAYSASKRVFRTLPASSSVMGVCHPREPSTSFGMQRPHGAGDEKGKRSARSVPPPKASLRSSLIPQHSLAKRIVSIRYPSTPPLFAPPIREIRATCHAGGLAKADPRSFPHFVVTSR